MLHHHSCVMMQAMAYPHYIIACRCYAYVYYAPLNVLYENGRICQSSMLHHHSCVMMQAHILIIACRCYAIETDTIPKNWKHANVAPAFKKGERYKAENYRPISLTCICCKLMEHIITSNIMKQHGFRKARSCESQLLPFIQELNASNNKNIQTDLIIMDFAKKKHSIKFPTVDYYTNWNITEYKPIL